METIAHKKRLIAYGVLAIAYSMGAKVHIIGICNMSCPLKKVLYFLMLTKKNWTILLVVLESLDEVAQLPDVVDHVVVCFHNPGYLYRMYTILLQI